MVEQDIVRLPKMCFTHSALVGGVASHDIIPSMDAVMDLLCVFPHSYDTLGTKSVELF